MGLKRAIACITLLSVVQLGIQGKGIAADNASKKPLSITAQSAVPAVDTMKVYYATNRKLLDLGKVAPKPPDHNYGNWFGGDLSFGTAEMHVPPKQPDWSQKFSSKRSYLTSVRAEDKYWNKSKQITLTPSQDKDFPDAVRSSKKVLVYVHGYNTSLDKAIKTVGRIAYDYQAMSPTGEAITPVVFSWPSTEKIFSYIADEERVSLSTSMFHKFMEKVFTAQQSGADAPSLYIVSHSMGNRLMLNYLADRGSKMGSQPAAGQRIVHKWLMCSPDVSTLQYVSESEDAAKVITPIRVLFSDSDRALAMSEELHESPRLGRPAVSTALLKFLSFLPPSMAKALYFKVDLMPEWLPDLLADKMPGVIKDNGLVQGVQGTVSKATAGVTKVASLPGMAYQKVRGEPQPMQDPNTVFIDFTQLDIGQFRLALLPITIQLGHSLPGPVIAHLLQDSESAAAPPQWTEVPKNRIFQLATNKTEPLAKRTIRTKRVVYDTTLSKQTSASK